MDGKLTDNYSYEEILKAIAALDAHILIKQYQKENIIFKRIKINEPIPFDRYIEDLGLQEMVQIAQLNFYEENDFEADRLTDFDSICFDIFIDRIDYVFTDIPINKSIKEDELDIQHYKYGIYEHIKSIYHIFKEIIATDIDDEPFDIALDILDKNTMREYYTRAIKFILAIRLKRLRQGRRIDRYINTLPYINPLLMRLIKKNKGHYYLKNSDFYSLDYTLALFSCFQFMSDYNTKLFELKILKWEQERNTL